MRKPRSVGHPRFAAAVALAGVSAVVGASFASAPSDEAGRVQLGAARSEVSPDVLLAAVVQTFFGPVTILPTTQAVDPAVFSAAIAALVDGHTNTVNTQMAGPNALNIPLWVLPGSTANAGGAVNSSGGPAGGTNGAASVLGTVNQLGPLTYILNNLGTIRFSNPPDPTAPAGSRPDFHAADMNTWLAGLAGVTQSAGSTGWIVNNTFGSSDGGVADATGLLQTANNFGPAFFNLNVLKSMAFVQAPNGTVLPDGQLDAIHATDIGQWAAGIPGLITNTGTTGFVADRGFGIGYGTAGWVGGLQTTTTIGSFSFTFDFLPSVGFGAPPPTMTPFASSPPPATLVSTARTSAGDEVTAFKSAEPEPTAEPSEFPVPDAATAVSEAKPAADDTSSTEAAAPKKASTTAPATTTTTDPAKTTVASPAGDDSTKKDQPTHTSHQRPAETEKPAGATTPDADSPNEATGKHGSGDTSVGRHRADDEQTGKHRSDTGSSSSQSGSESSESKSAG